MARQTFVRIHPTGASARFFRVNTDLGGWAVEAGWFKLNRGLLGWREAAFLADGVMFAGRTVWGSPAYSKDEAQGLLDKWRSRQDKAGYTEEHRLEI